MIRVYLGDRKTAPTVPWSVTHASYNVLVTYTRRRFGITAGKLAAIGLASGAFASANSVISGVRVGAQSYTFRDLLFNGTGDPIDELIAAMKAVGITECELMQSHTEPRSFLSQANPTSITPDGKVSEDSLYGEIRRKIPPPTAADLAAREEQRKWRLNVSLDHYRAIRRKFDAAGIRLYAFNATFGAVWWRDQNGSNTEDLDRPFEVAKALGAEVITVSTTVSTAKRMVPLVDKHKILVALHNHARREDSDQFARPETFEQAMAWSKYYRVNLDIGHFVAANYDPIEYIQKNAQRITNLHLKDRKKNNGMNLPWGQGDTPIKEVLQLMKKNRYDFPAMIEWEYQGSGRSSVEAKRCFEYVKAALA